MKTFTCVSKLWRERIALVQTLTKLWQNPDKTPTKLQENLVRFAALFCLLVMAGVGSMQASQYVYDCSNNNNWVTTSGGSTKVSYGTAFTTTCYYTDGTAWSGTGGSNCSLNSSGYFFLGKSGATLVLPTYTNEKITSVVLHSSSGHSTSVSVNIYTTGGTAASSVVTWSTKNKDYVYAISTSYQASTLRIQVTNAYNTQFTRITINTAPNSSCAGTQLATPEVTATPSSGQIQLSWPAVANATKYQVSWNGGKFTDATSPFTKTSLTNSTPYTWAVKAIGNGSTYCDSEANEGSTKPSSTVYTITWKVYGESDKTTKVASGDHLMLPPSPSSCAVGTEFAGWSATNIGGTPTDTKPTFVSSQTTISANQTYYAVFATRTTNSYTKGDINDLFPGQTVLIVNESNAKALSDEYVAGQSGKRLQKVDVSISSSKITSSNTHIIWTVENCGLKYNFKTSTGYLRATMTGNDQLACNKGTDPWTLTSAGSNKFYMNSNSSVTSRLEYYSTNSYFTTYGTNATGTAYEMSFFVPTYTQYFTSCASCTADPTIGAASITNDPFVLTSLTGTITVNCSGGSTGSDNCTWADRGYVWSLGTTTTTPTVSNNKVAGTNGDKATGWAGWITPSGSTTPTAWEVGKTYYIRAYGKNGKDGATFAYGTAASFTLRSITFHSNGGTSVGPWYVNSGGTYEAPTAPTKDGFVFGGWYTDDGTFENPVNWSAAVSENKDYYARWFTYGDYVFSCAELTLTPKLVTASTPIFITSTVGDNWVRSADSILVEGSGLSASQTVSFTLSDPSLSEVFRVRKKDFTELQTNGSGGFDANTYVYIFYKPAAGSTSDGLDKLTSITATVGGSKPKTVVLEQSIMGRHLPAKFVIAAKNTTDGKWYALPNPSTTLENPEPVEIAVNNATNPTTAYTAKSNIFSLCGQASGASGYLEEDGQWIKLGMPNNSNYPLFGAASDATDIKSDDGAIYTNNIGKQYWWELVQTYTGSMSAAARARYTIKMANNPKTLSAWWNAAGGPKWGLYAAGNGEHTLRLIPASTVVFAEAEIVEWGQHGFVIEVDAQGIDATSVVGTLGSTSSSAITLVQTGTSKGSNNSKYTYTVDFGATFDFAASANYGALLRLAWKKGSTTKAMSNVTIPKIIAATTDMSSIDAGTTNWKKWEVHVLPGVTLTANAGDFTSSKVTIKHLEIYPGATVKVTEGTAASGTLTATTIVLRNGWQCVGGRKYDVSRLYVTPSTATLKATNVYSDWYIDFDQYYPIAVPWEVDLSANDGSKIWYKNTNSSAIIGTSGSVRLRYYDGASRATNVQTGVGSGANWKHYGDVGAEAIPTKLVPGKGYAMTARRPTGKTFSVIRMPMALPSGAWTSGTWTTNGELGVVSSKHKDQVSVTAHVNEAGTTPQYAKGWNFIANPFMSLYQGPITHSVSDDYDIEYVSIPDTEFKEFGQYPIGADMTKLAPSSGFLIQAEADGVLTFGTTYRKASAPSYRNSEMKTASKQKAYIILSDESAEDMMGILVSEKYTAEYELNADLEKLLSDGNTLRTYMSYNNLNMAYLAINEELAKELIPVAVRIPADGEYTFKMHEGSVVNELEGVYLTDYETGNVTNLLYNDYTFTAETGTLSNRFAINAIVGVHTTPTSLDITGADKDGPTKFIYHDKVFILHNGVIYDSTGKRVNVINK